MSLLRTGIRVAIRAAAPPLLGLYILYKYWLKIEHTTIVKNTIKAYKKLYVKIKTKFFASHEEPETHP